MTDEELLCENVAKEFWAKRLSDEELKDWETARLTDAPRFQKSYPDERTSLEKMSDEGLKILAKLVNDEVWRRVK